MTRPPTRRKRRRRPGHNADNEPPAPVNQGHWSGRNLLLVLLAVFGTPALLLTIFGRGDIVKAFGLGVAGVIVISLITFRRLSLFERWID